MLVVIVDRQIQQDNGNWASDEKEFYQHHMALRLLAQGWLESLQAGERLVVTAEEMREEEFRYLKANP